MSKSIETTPLQKIELPVSSPTKNENTKMLWIVGGLVIVIGMVVVWLYKRIQMLETKIESMDRVVENTLSKHEKSLTEKMEKFENASSQQKQFIQEKVDELTKTVQQHMAYLRSHSQPVNIPATPKAQNEVHNMPNISNISNMPGMHSISGMSNMSGMSGMSNMSGMHSVPIMTGIDISNKPQTIDIIIPIPPPPKSKSTTTLEIIEEDDEKELDKELEEELRELNEESIPNDNDSKEDII